MKIFAASLMVMCLASSTAMAQPACVYGIDQTVTSLSECAAYERTRVSCALALSPSDNDAWIGPSRKLSRAMGDLMLRIARIAEIPNDDVVERMQAASEKMLTTMSGNCTNFSVLKSGFMFSSVSIHCLSLLETATCR
jgi:hypothetical protein